MGSTQGKGDGICPYGKLPGQSEYTFARIPRADEKFLKTETLTVFLNRCTPPGATKTAPLQGPDVKAPIAEEQS